MPTTPHPVNPTRPRPLPGPKPAPTEPKKLVLAAAEYVGIAACIVSSIAIATLFGRADLLTGVFVMTFLITSLALSPERRDRRPRIAPAGAAVGGTAGGSPT